MSQKQFAESIGVTYQQVHKYDLGTNRVAANRLHEISILLQVPMTYFFDGFEEGVSPEPASSHERMIIQIVRDFGQIKNADQQLAISKLVHALAGD